MGASGTKLRLLGVRRLCHCAWMMQGSQDLALRQPASWASASLQNQRSPAVSSIRVAW